MGDEELYDEVLMAFLKDDSIEKSEKAARDGDLKRLFECVYTLKSACGNIDMIDVYNAASELTELIRLAKVNKITPEITGGLKKLKREYNKARTGISKAMNGC